MKKFLVFGLGLLLALTTMSCGDFHGSISENLPIPIFNLPAGQIDGYVYEDSSASPLLDRSVINSAEVVNGMVIPGATVRISGTNLSAITDENGYFSIDNVPPGVHKIIIEYIEAGGTISYSAIIEGINVPHDVGLHLGWLKCDKTGEIAGTVTLEGSQTGNSGITVFIPGTTYQDTTNYYGYYEIERVPAGTYQVAAAKEGYCTQTVDGVVVVTGLRTENVNMNLTRCAGSGIMTGFAYLSDQTNHSGISVSVEGTTFSTTTAANGSWSIINLPPGVYTVLFTKSGYNSVRVDSVLIEARRVTTVEDVYLTRVELSWQTFPHDLSVRWGDTFSGQNGIAVSNSPSSNLQCTLVNNACSFNISVSGSGAGLVACQLDFTAGPAPEFCSFQLKVTDGFNVLVSSPVNIEVRSRRWYVDFIATGAHTGLTWQDAFTHPQEGMNAAVAEDEVWVAMGTYTSGTTDPVIAMKDGVRIYGGFARIETDISQRGDPANHPTILDGENTSFHVVIGASDSRLDGLTITRGNAINDGTCKTNYRNNNCNGGGIYNAYINRMVIANCIIEGNKAGHRGAAIENYFSSPTISNVVFRANSAVYWNGGAIYNWTSSPVITDCRFLNNTAGDHGGAMDSYLNSYPVIIRCVFDGNYAVAYGGALNNWTSTYATVINSLFLRNQTNDLGGAMYNYRNTISITNCTFSGNSSKNQGGALYNNMATSVVIKNSILWGDTSGDGREITNSSSSPTITYSDIQGGYTGTGNLDLSPLFVEYPDVHLQSGSPCINTGTATDAPLNDFDGNPRPSPTGGAFDMGAYEYQWP